MTLRSWKTACWTRTNRQLESHLFFITAVSACRKSSGGKSLMSLDIFGALAQCGSCKRTKKRCTFEWLRSQRSVKTPPQRNTTPPAKKSRTQGSPPNTSNTPYDGLPFDFCSNILHSDLGLAVPHDDTGNVYKDTEVSLEDNPDLLTCFYDINESKAVDQSPGQDYPFDTVSGSRFESLVYQGVGERTMSKKRRSRSPSGTEPSRLDSSRSLSIANNLLSVNNVFLTEGLLKIYHDSIENALSCWLTEQTCPYSSASDDSSIINHTWGWNRIYHRVFRLDRMASPVRGKSFSIAEDKAASKAINLAILSFATQWAQSSKRSKATYSQPGSDTTSVWNWSGTEFASERENFDRRLQISAWHEARMALQDAAEIESFRVVFAQIVFSLTQKPIDQEEKNGAERTSLAEEVSECEDWMRRLDLTIEGEGPPIHLEQGLRLIHSLRSRMALSGASANDFNSTDKDTVDLLFWLGVMFDTLSSAMHKRPLVVSDEDSEAYTNDPGPAVTAHEKALNEASKEEESHSLSQGTEGLWDNFLFARQHTRFRDPPVRWPCSYEIATRLLRDAAPVKVLLFRKITRIQSLLSRPSTARGAAMQKAISSALEVYDRWNRLYAPFIQDCIESHDDLPPQIQSWYICLTGHWHLATLLLADLLETIDASPSGKVTSGDGEESKPASLVAALRRKNCFALSDLARCACPRDDASFPQSREFHFAVNQGALLTEPWTAVLIRAFVKAGSVLLQSTRSVQSGPWDNLHKEEALGRAENCCQALFYLGKKSDQALAAAKILREGLNQNKILVEEEVQVVSDCLDTELWGGFNDIPPALGVNTA